MFFNQCEIKVYFVIVTLLMFKIHKLISSGFKENIFVVKAQHRSQSITFRF